MNTMDLDLLAENMPPPVELPVAHTLGEFTVDPATGGGCLLGNRFLCRGGGLLFVGTTGVGKSVLTLTFMIQFALGHAAFGIRPVSRLRSLIIQAENDDGDLAEMRNGIFEGLKLSPADREVAASNVLVVNESTTTGVDFVNLCERLATQHKPDLMVVDPLFAYLGDSVTDQRAVSGFLRNGLNPVLQRNHVGLFLVHHCNKPPSGTQRPDWRAGDLAYLGSGSAELANWARAMIALRSIGSHDVFELVFAKRGKRAGVVDADGNPVFSQYIKHSKSGICWEPASEEDLPGTGRPTQHTANDLLASLNGESLSAVEWQKRVLDEHGISRATFFRLRDALVKAKKISQPTNDKKWSISR